MDDTVALVGLAVLGPAFVALVVWLVAIRPARERRAHHARILAVAPLLGCEARELEAVGRRGAHAITVTFTRSRYRVGKLLPCTACRVWFGAPLARPLSISTRGDGAGVARQRAGEVWIGGPDPEARALAERLAPLVEARAAAASGTLEVDRASCGVVLDGWVVEVATLERAIAAGVDLAVAIETAQR